MTLNDQRMLTPTCGNAALMTDTFNSLPRQATDRRALGWLFTGRLFFAAFLLVLVASTARAGPAEQLYQQVLDNYRVLDKQPEKHRDRASWERCIQGFQQVLQHDARGELAPKCLFLMAQSHQHLYHFYKAPRDSQAVIQHYQTLLRDFPSHSLADDALYLLAVFYQDELHDAAAAYAQLQRLIQQFPSSDMTLKAREKIAQIERLRAPRAALSRAGGKKSSDTGKNTTVTDPKTLKSITPVPTEPAVQPYSSAKPADQATATKAAQPTAPIGKRKPKDSRTAGQASTPTLAQQLGLGVGRIVLDPGHGGKDSGAISLSGLREKDVVLNIAKMLKLALERETRCQVMLTRTTDRYLTLAERTAFANAKKADVFISIHANAAENRSLGGVETYFLNLASDPQAARVAALENASAKKQMSDLQSILKDLMLKSKTSESSRLAQDVQNRIVTRLRERYKDTRDLGVKRAPFLVLVGAEMPAILVETAFLSNEQEELRLADTTFQDTLSRGIAAGVATYIQQLSADRRQSTASR
jgi:N-acetylmuramoyl-L-alanine amidase